MCFSLKNMKIFSVKSPKILPNKFGKCLVYETYNFHQNLRILIDKTKKSKI